MATRTTPAPMPRACGLIRWAFLLSATFLLTTHAHAEPSAADKQTARNLLIEGRQLLESGDARAALAKFQAAHEIMRVPTTGLDVAKALEALGQLVEARAMAYEVTQIPEQANESAAFKDARASAAAAIEGLESRIPAFVLRIEGASKQTVQVTVDGEKVPAAALTMALARNPGTHEVVVKAPGFRTARQTVALKEGVAAPVEVPVLLEREAPVVVAVPEAGRSKGLMYAGVGVAGALAVVGVGTAIGAGAIYGPAQDKLDGKCESNCKNEFESLVSTQQTLAYASLFTFIGAGLVGGATLAYALSGKTPSDLEKTPQAAVVVMPGGGGVFVSGRW